MSLGSKIKLRRKQLTMTQAELAEKVGVRQSTIGNIEARGITATKHAGKIADALGVSIEWLMLDEDDKRLSDNLPSINGKRSGVSWRNFPSTTEIHKMIKRFYLLFETHQIPLFIVPDLLDNRICRSDLLTPESLVDKLDLELVTYISNLFHVECNWLIGFSDDVYKFRRWNKFEIDRICKQLLHYQELGYKIEVVFSANKKTNKDTFIKARKNVNERELMIGVAIQITKQINDLEFTTYEIWNEQPWEVFSARLSLKTLILFCARHRIPKRSHDLSAIQFRALFSQHSCLAFEYFYKEKFQAWNPSDFLSNSDDNPEPDEIQYVKEEYLEKGLHELVAPNAKYE